MPAFNFKKQFVPFIRAKTKRHTIRADQKDGKPRAKVGDVLHHYCGMRTKSCFRIVPPVICTKVEPITITENPLPMATPRFEVTVGGYVLDKSEKERLAQADGFPDFASMMKFWDGRLPFKGSIIHWS